MKDNPEEIFQNSKNWPKKEVTEFLQLKMFIFSGLVDLNFLLQIQKMCKIGQARKCVSP